MILGACVHLTSYTFETRRQVHSGGDYAPTAWTGTNLTVKPHGQQSENIFHIDVVFVTDPGLID